MNYLKLSGLCLFCACLCMTASAQERKIPINEPNYTRPHLFDALPGQIHIETAELKNLLSGQAETGKQVSINFTDKTVPVFNGKIVSVADKYESKIRTLIIRLSNFSGATLTLSSSTLSDGTVRFTGRIISFQHGDLYVLELQNQQYYLIKKNYNDLINE